jgi:acyl transferase domain-containing protein
LFVAYFRPGQHRSSGLLRGESFHGLFRTLRQSQDGQTHDLSKWDAWQDVGLATKKAEWFKTTTANYRNVDHPLLGECVDESVDRKEYLTKYSIDNFWTLDEHRIAGHALLPGTAYLEIARAAFEDHAQTDAMELTDVYFLNILHLGDREQKENAHSAREKRK